MTNISPVVFPYFGTATQLSVRINAHQSDAITCSITGFLLTDAGETAYQKEYNLTPAEFAAWGEDNFYLIEIMARELNVSIVS
jgi:hypothetical protein